MLEKHSLDSVCVQPFTLSLILAMLFLPAIVSYMLQCLRTHALQLGSEAMVSPLPAAPPRSVEVASSAAFAAESPRWPSHRAAESVSKLEGAQEAGWLNGASRTTSDAGWRMTLPP